MKQECGNPDIKTWLIGDSSPTNWKDILDTPFDSRHPIRHNIWTSIIDVIQDKIYKEIQQRIDDSNLFIRNAIYDPKIKPKGTVLNWESEVRSEVLYLKSMMSNYKPIIVLSFGAFSFEFARRANDESAKKYTHWSTVNLGNEFRSRCQNFDPQKINIIPLLHRSISGGRFIQSHEYFCNKTGANYFNIVGKELSNIFITHKSHFPNWL